jgi:hypothetical protein
MPKKKREPKFRVPCRLDGSAEATVTIHQLGETVVITVKPLGKHHSYTLPLGIVAEIVAYKVVKLQKGH